MCDVRIWDTIKASMRYLKSTWLDAVLAPLGFVVIVNALGVDMTAGRP